MTSKVERDEDGKPIGMSRFEIGKASMQLDGFVISIESKWEMEMADGGSFVSCGFVCHEQILITPDGDVFRGVPYPRLVRSLQSWVSTQTEEDMLLEESQEDAERRANEDCWPGSEKDL